MIVSHLMHLRTIAGLVGILLVAIVAAIMLAGPAAAHCDQVPLHHHCDGGDTGTDEAATFAVVVLGDIDRNGSFTATQDIGKNESQISFGNSGHGEFIDLDMAGFVGKNPDPDWDKCFAAGEFKVVGGVSADKNDPGFGWAGFWFMASSTDPTTDIWYHLAVKPVTIGAPVPAADPPAVWPDWLPAEGQTVTVTGGPWKMQHSGGPGRKVACTGDGMEGTVGDGTLHFEIKIKPTSRLG